MVDLSYKRFPMNEKKISEIGPEDIRVSIIGLVVDSSEDKIVIDDKTGTIEVLLNTMDEKIESNLLVRVIGKVVSENGTLIKAESIQDFSGFDLELYEKLKKIKSI